MTINQRIELLISTLNLNNNAFSHAIGVNSTIIHNIVKGRNAPSYDILNKISLSFENINMNWIIAEQGEILTENSEFKFNGVAEPAAKSRLKSESCEKCIMKDELISSLKREVETLSKYNHLLESK